MGLDFTSKQDEAQPPVEVEFRLDGEPFKCVLRRDGDAVLEWSELAAGASEEDITSPAGAAFISRFFRLMMRPDQYTAFRAHMRTHDTLPETLVEIMQGVNEEMEKVVEAETERPTKESSRSSPGRGAKADRTSTIISLVETDEGEFAYVDKPPSPRRQPQRKRRRAG